MNKLPIKTKYTINDTVYVMVGCHICNATITDIHVTVKHICHDGKRLIALADISYSISPACYYDGPVPEDKLFSSPKEATAKILSDYYHENQQE